GFITCAQHRHHCRRRNKTATQRTGEKWCAVALEGPRQKRAVSHCIRPVTLRDDGTVRQISPFVRFEVDRRPAGGKSFGVEPYVDLVHPRSRDREGFAETGDENLRPGAPAIEARPVAGSERGHLIEEEELCPADTPAWRVAPHHDAAAAAEFARADEP